MPNLIWQLIPVFRANIVRECLFPGHDTCPVAVSNLCIGEGHGLLLAMWVINIDVWLPWPDVLLAHLNSYLPRSVMLPQLPQLSETPERSRLWSSLTTWIKFIDQSHLHQPYLYCWCGVRKLVDGYKGRSAWMKRPIMVQFREAGGKGHEKKWEQEY